MNNRIIEKDKLLDENGKLKHRGYATSLILDYERKAIKAPGFKIKEWDYYLLINDDFAVALTIADNSYMSLISASFSALMRSKSTSAGSSLSSCGTSLP